MLDRQLASIPVEQREKIMKILEENPEQLMQLAQEVQQEMTAGKSQQAAMLAVAQKHKDTIGKLFGM